MTLVEEIDGFIRELRQNQSSAAAQSLIESMALLKDYLSCSTPSPRDLTPAIVRDFLSRWYVEAAASRALPSHVALLDTLTCFLKWLDQRSAITPAVDCSSVLEELARTLPRALEITTALSKHLAARGGAFSFPEFLTTFADGGQSQYDVDVAGEGGGPGALEGYFRVVRVEGSFIEVEEMISEERAWPLMIPREIAPLIEPGFVLNLEIVREGEGWQIAACGFAYPPGAAVP